MAISHANLEGVYAMPVSPNQGLWDIPEGHSLMVTPNGLRPIPGPIQEAPRERVEKWPGTDIPIALPPAPDTPPAATTAHPVDDRTLSGHFSDYDRYLKRLADAQRYKLRINAHKGDLGSVPIARLLQLLRKEVGELQEAIERGSEIEIILEASDVCNFALGCAISAIRSMNGD